MAKSKNSAVDKVKRGMSESEAVLKPQTGVQGNQTDSAKREGLIETLKNARKYHGSKQKRVGMLFSGGPAPAGNAVISGAALQFLNDGWEVIGFYMGYQSLVEFNRENPLRLAEGVHYKRLNYDDVTKIRQLGGITIKTSRTNPSNVDGFEVRSVEDLLDPTKNYKLYNVLDALEFMGIQALISIGGDDTLKTAYYLHLLGLPVVHVPKTIDNDYYGIPWTFGYFTAIEQARKAIKVYNMEAMTTDCWWILELMGRKTGWYTIGAGISGEAVRMIGPEEFGDDLDLKVLVDDIVDLMLKREKFGKRYGVILVSEGLVDRLSLDDQPKEVDDHGNIAFSEAKFGFQLSNLVKKAYEAKAGQKLSIKSETIGYTTRCAEPSAFDILLGSQLGMGAFRLIWSKQFGHMVSVGDNLEIKAVPFHDLIDLETFRTRLRYVPVEGDFFKLAKSLEYRRLYDDD